MDINKMIIKFFLSPFYIMWWLMKGLLYVMLLPFFAIIAFVGGFNISSKKRNR